MTKPLIPLLCALLLAAPAHAAQRYFEGSLVIEETNNHGTCAQNVGKTKEFQISWDESRKNGNSKISGWIVVSGGAPGKLDGESPTQITITSNNYDRSLNTPISLSLEIADGKATGVLRETPATLSFEQNMCYWQKAKLTLTEKTTETKVVTRMREHSAWYKSYTHESRGDYEIRYKNFAEATAAYDQAITEVDGVLPDYHSHFTSLLFYSALLHSKINDHEHASQRYQRIMDISVRQKKLGINDPALYRGWIRLANSLYLAKHADKALPVIQRAAQLEDKTTDVDVEELLDRLNLHSNIYIAEKMFDKAKEAIQDEIDLATAKLGPNAERTYEARTRLILVMKRMKDNARFEAAFEPLTNEINTRFGESHRLSLETNEILGMYYFSNNDLTKARFWLERVFRGHRALFDSTTQTIRNEDAKSTLAILLDIYINQGIVAKDFLDQVREGKASLDDLPFHAAQSAEMSLPAGNLAPIKWDKILQQ